MPAQSALLIEQIAACPGITGFHFIQDFPERIATCWYLLQAWKKSFQRIGKFYSCHYERLSVLDTLAIELGISLTKLQNYLLQKSNFKFAMVLYVQILQKIPESAIS
jgi:hypothetical protein